MNKIIKFGIYTTVIMALIYACSTERNTAINRSYHYLTARYNGHFNANELLMVSLGDFRANLSEDFYSLVPIEAIPNEIQVESLYPSIDTAISKIKVVITDHSMPSNDKPSKKNAEHNNYIDENWITLGKAYYYRRDYEIALKSFKFINTYFSNDPSNYIGEVWMAKTNIRLGNLTDAKLSLDKLDKILQNQKDGVSKSSNSSSKSKKSKAAKLNDRSGGKKEEEEAKFPKKILFEFARTKADLALAQKDIPKAIEQLELALDDAKLSEDKGRVNFVLGQLYESQNQHSDAIAHYKKARKYKIPYQMSFNAQLKASILEGGPKIKKELNKLLKDTKNAEFKDQVYYALAMIELKEGNEDLAMKHLSNSAFYSTSNMRQKGMAFEKMGDLRYVKKDYIKAQKYYDSCAIAITDEYPNAKDIRTKAEKLKLLVDAVETAQYEDSIQRIAMMDPVAQEDFLKKVIKQREADEKAKAQREAEKLRELAKTANAALITDGKGGGYWSNAKSIQDGATEFQKRWGTRANEDHWRRSDKQIVNFSPSDEMAEDADTTTTSDKSGNSTLANNSKPAKETVEDLMAGLPKTEEDFLQSNERMVEALYKAGIIYKEQLKEKELAITQFQKILDRNIETEYNLMAAFQLYKIHENNDLASADGHKRYILDNYPESEYARYMRDPDYFIKKREREQLADQEYINYLNLYNRKVYYPVMAKAQTVVESEPENKYRAKYMLLWAMSKGQTTENKQELVPMLERLVQEYPDTEESVRANGMLDVIKNGFSKSEPVVFGNQSIFTYEDKASQIVLILLKPTDNIDLSKSKVSDFTREYFPKSKAKITTNLYGTNQNVIMVAEFANEIDAKEYVRTFKKTKKHLLDLNTSKLLIITPKNLKLLYEKQQLEQYEKFYEDYY